MVKLLKTQELNIKNYEKEKVSLSMSKDQLNEAFKSIEELQVFY